MQSIEEHKKRVSSRSSAEKQKRKAAVDHLRMLRRKYKPRLFPGPGRAISFGRIFLDRGGYGRALEHITGRSDFGSAVGYLRDIGTIGPIIHSILSFAAGRPHARSKRKLVVKTLETLPAAKAKRFRALVFATARYLYQNHQTQGALHDSRAENAVFEVFGELAKNSKSYRPFFDPSEPSADSGKKYYRYILRNDILLKFRFLRENYSAERMAALKHGLVGETIDELTERQDLERLKFVSSIFSHDGETATIERFLNGQHRGRAIYAFITLQYKAMNLNIEDRNSFFRGVCKYYEINPKEVFDAAKSLYYDPKLQAKKGQFIIDDKTKKLLEIAEQARAVYDFQPSKKKPEKK